MCKVLSYVVERECLLLPVHSVGKTLLASDLLCFVLQSRIYLLLQIGEGNGPPPQYSCLENPMDGGAW